MSAAIQPASYYLDEGNKYRHGRPRIKRQEQTTKKEHEMGMCLAGCGNTEYSRGLCINCYQSALRDVHEGSTTWAELELAKLAKPSKRPTRGSDFHKKLSEFRQNASLGSRPDAPEQSIGPLSPNDAETFRSYAEGHLPSDHPEVDGTELSACQNHTDATKEFDVEIPKTLQDSEMIARMNFAVADRDQQTEQEYTKAFNANFFNEEKNTAIVVNEGTENYEVMLQPGSSGRTTKDYGDPEVNAMMAARLKPIDPRLEAHQPPHPDDVNIDIDF
jgi:hypothetical protein